MSKQQQQQQHQRKHQRRQQQQHSDSTSDQDEQDQRQYKDQAPANLLSLKLRKPNHWNWELSTSRNSSNIALPRILLYDHTGTLLLDANKCSEQTYRPFRDQDCRRKRAATVNLEQSLQQAQLSGKFDGLRIGESTSSDIISTPRRRQLVGSCIDFSTHELPDWQPHGTGSSRRSSLMRGVRFDVEDQPLIPAEQEPRGTEMPVYPTPPSTSTLTTTANSSSSGPAEKRRYRRSHSYGQRSILERISMSRGRHSSPEYVQEQAVDHGPQYFLRSSKAGTLVIKEESIRRVRQRHRRPRHSSSDNILVQQNGSTANSVVQVTAHKRHQHKERSRGSLLLSSDEDSKHSDERLSTRQSRCRRSKRACGKDVPRLSTGCGGTNVASPELVAVDPDNCVY